MAKKTVTNQTITGISNADFWNLARAKDPKFRESTSKVTSDFFTEKGFEALALNSLDILNDFYTLSMRIAFQKVDVSGAKNPLADSGLVEIYSTPNGGMTQRIAIDSLAPISPAYKGLKNGDSPDPFIVRKANTKERFFQQNAQYANLVTISDFEARTMFINEYGVGEYISGIMRGLDAGYTLFEYLNTKECINTAINTTVTPLQNTQKLAVPSWTAAGATASDLKGLLLTIKDLKTAMSVSAQTGAYNANGFKTVVSDEDYVVLMRAGIKNRIDLEVALGSYNPDRLSLEPFSVVEVDDFGGLEPKDSNEGALQPVYEQLGTVVGYIDASVTVNGYATQRASDGEWIVSVTSGSTTADTTIVHPEDVTWSDPNAEILAVVAQKGVVFENRQNPYNVRPVRNERGLYTNYWCSSPNNSICYDANYNFVVITKPTE